MADITPAALAVGARVREEQGHAGFEGAGGRPAGGARPGRAACGGGDEGARPAWQAPPRPRRSAWCSTRPGGATSRSMTPAAAGLDAAKQQLGDQIEVTSCDPPRTAPPKEILDSLASDGYQPLLGSGFAFGPDIVKSANENPDVQYRGRCLRPALHPEEEPDLPAVQGARGIVHRRRGRRPQDHRQHGWLRRRPGGRADQEAEAGYKAGVDYINKTEGKNVKVLTDYAGTTLQAFSDPAKGKELALKQIGQGADVLYHAAGGTGAGVISRPRPSRSTPSGSTRPEPHRQRGRARGDPDLDAQAGRHRRAEDHRSVRRRPADHRQHPVVPVMWRAASTTPRTSTTRSCSAT